MGEDKERRDTSDMQREKWKLKDKRGEGKQIHRIFQEGESQGPE